jgi:predicted dehydrogenase
MNEVRIGIVGVGNMGKEHRRYFPELRGARLGAV